jgi:hypothetical protein
MLPTGKLRDIDANITVMIQADMLAYRKQGRCIPAYPAIR